MCVNQATAGIETYSQCDFDDYGFKSSVFIKIHWLWIPGRTVRCSKKNPPSHSIYLLHLLHRTHRLLRRLRISDRNNAFRFNIWIASRSHLEGWGLVSGAGQVSQL